MEDSNPRHVAVIQFSRLLPSATRPIFLSIAWIRTILPEFKARCPSARRQWIVDDTHLVPSVGFEPTFSLSESDFLPVRRQGIMSSFSDAQHCARHPVKGAEDSVLETPSVWIHSLSTGRLRLAALSSWYA